MRHSKFDADEHEAMLKALHTRSVEVATRVLNGLMAIQSDMKDEKDPEDTRRNDDRLMRLYLDHARDLLTIENEYKELVAIANQLVRSPSPTCSRAEAEMYRTVVARFRETNLCRLYEAARNVGIEMRLPESLAIEGKTAQ